MKRLGDRELLLLSAASLSPREVRAWTGLANRAAEPNPFFRPEFVLAACHGGLDDALLLVVAEGDRWIACLPSQPALRWRRIPGPCLSPWLPHYAYFAIPHVDRDELDNAVDALIGGARGLAQRAAIVLDPIDGSGPVGDALRRSLDRVGIRPIVYADFGRAAIRRRHENDYLDSRVSARKRKDLKRRRRGLAHALGGALQVVDRAQDSTARETFLELERSTWKGIEGTALTTSGHASFFREMCAAMAAQGRLELLSLEGPAGAAAMQCNLIDGGIVYSFKVAYEQRLARFSPGVLLDVEAIRRFHERTTLSMVDSCTAPDNAMLDWLWPDQRHMQALIVPTRRWTAMAVRPAIAAESAARQLKRRLQASRSRPRG